QLREGWRVQVGYAFLHMALTADPILPAGTRTGAEAVAGQSPAHPAPLQASSYLGSHLQLDLSGRFVGRLHGFNPTGTREGDAIPRYFSLGTPLAWRPHSRLELAVVGQNLLDAHHPETGTAQFLRTAPVEIRRGV